MTDRRYRNDFFPIDKACACYACQNFSRAYLNHLLRVGEVLSATLCSIHNIHWFHQFMGRMRQSILDGKFEEFRQEVHRIYPEKAAGAASFQGGTRGGRKGTGGSKRGRKPKRR